MSRGKPTRNVIDVCSVDLRGSRCKSRHPGLKESPPELERVLSDKDKVDGLQHGELVEEDARDHRHDEEEKLRHDDAEVGHAQDLGADDARDADGGDPHDAVDHGQDDLVDDGKKLDDGLGPRAEGAEDSSEGQAEEDDAEGVGSGPRCAGKSIFYTCVTIHCSFFLDRHVYLYVSCLANSTLSLVLTLTYLVLAWKGEKARLKNCSHLSLSPMRTHVYSWPQKTTYTFSFLSLY